MKKQIPKYIAKTALPGATSSGLSSMQGVYGQVSIRQQGHQGGPPQVSIPNPASSQLSSIRPPFPSPQPLRKNVSYQLHQHHDEHEDNAFNASLKDTRFDPVPKMLPDGAMRLKDFPLSTKNKSIPPFPIPGAQNSPSPSRNLPPVLPSPIQQAKSQYHK